MRNQMSLKGIADGIIANAIWQCGLSALPSLLPFAAQMFYNMRNAIATHLEASIMIATTITSILLYCLTFALFRLWAAKKKCGELTSQLAAAKSPQAEVAAKSAQLRAMILDDAIAAKRGMAEKAKETEGRRQEAAYAGLSPHLRKMVDELSAKCLAELNKGTA